MSTVTTFEAGSWIWIDDDVEIYLPAKVKTSFRPGEVGDVELEDGKARKLTAKESPNARPCDPDALKTYENMVKLNDLNEPTILHNLRNRYKKYEIYTYVGTILIAVNPFKLLPIYTPEIQDIYKEKGSRDTPPHIYAVADLAYNNLLADRVNQSIVISGESGAGKTETMKLVLQYLAEVSGRAQKRSATENTESLEQQILKSNPVMEAFGNAKTVRNNNSSRFGKWTEINFNQTGTIIGGSIINYLLEKSRIPFQAGGERNYHVFYQLLAGGEVYADMKAKYALKDAEEYHYLNQSGVTTVDNINDEKDYEEMTGAMSVLNMTPDETEQVLRLVAAILHMGNIEYFKAGEDDAAKIKNQPQVDLVARLLNVDGPALSKALCCKNIGGTREVIYVQYSLAAAGDARDGLAKALYGELFNWLIQMINKALMAKMSGAGGASSKEKILTIGVLDIFGFESFIKNSFEQLCINFCNEKLQFHFNEHIFKLEQQEYESEGITVEHITFTDNQACLDLLELKGTGIFAMIDDEINVPRGSDEGFRSKVVTKHGKHQNFSVPPGSVADARISFTVHHYAGKVVYNATNFLEKNKDALHEDIRAVTCASTSPLFAQLLPPPENSKLAVGAKKKQFTLGTQFKMQLGDLMLTLNATEPHFVRCMKPNDLKKADVFQSGMMLAQLRYAGLLEVCRIRQIGYPVRKSFDDFVFRYRCLALTAAKDHGTLLRALEDKGIARKNQWQIGHTKVFMRNLQQFQFEAARDIALMDVVRKMQAQARKFIVRCRYLKWKVILNVVRDAMKARTLERVDAALADVPELPNLGKGAGKHLKLVRDAETLKERLELEKRVTELLQSAIAERDLASLQNAVKMADDMVFNTAVGVPLVAQAKALIERLLEERRVLAELKKAIERRDKPELESYLSKAAALDLQNHDLYKQAVALKIRMEEEESIRVLLRDAIKAASLPQLDNALGQMMKMGLNEEALYREGVDLKDFLTKQVEARAALAGAIAARSLDQLESAMTLASKAQLPESTAELVEARGIKARLVEEARMEEELVRISESKDLAAVTSALARAAALDMTTTPGCHKARSTKERLEAEAQCIVDLKAAVKANTVSALNMALAKATELGLTDTPEYAAADKASQKFAAQNKMFKSVQEAMKSGDLAQLDKAIEDLKKAGLGDDEQVKLAINFKQHLLEEGELVEQLSKAVSANDEAPMAALMDKAAKMNLGKRHPELMASATAFNDQLAAELKVASSITSAIKSRDTDALAIAVSKGKELSARGQTLKAALEAASSAESRFARQDSLTVELTAAMEAKDNNKIRALLAEAKTLELDNSKTREAEGVADRDRVVRDAELKLKKACDTFDLDALNDAMARAIELGVEGTIVEQAKAMRTRLDEEKDMAASLNAAMKIIKAKLAGRAPLAAAELIPLEQAVEEAKANGLRDDSPALKAGLELKNRLESILVLQEEIKAALESNESKIADFRKLMEKADKLDVSKDMVLMKSMRARLKQEEEKRSRKAMADVDDDDDEVLALDDEEQARAREEKIKKASQPKYHWTKFPHIRDADDFAKGVLLNKKKVKQFQLKWQDSVIARSLYDFQGDNNLTKLATRIHKALLGYSGDRSMSFPATLAQDILQKGLETPEIVDEIYLQICKHLSANPRPESCQRGWQVMCMCVGTFPPSRDYEDYLLNFILQHTDNSGAIGNYARYSLRRLEGILNSGPSGFVPSVDEIQAYKERPPILATIELVDGTPLTEDLPITPDLNVSKVLDICTHFMELQDPRMQYFGVFVEDVNDVEEKDEVVNPLLKGDEAKDAPLQKTPRPLQNESYMGDVVTLKVRQNQPFKFVFKRKIYLRHLDEPGDDPMYERLIYLQAVDEVILGNIPIASDEEVAQLVVRAMTVDLMEEMPETVDGMVEDADIREYIPVPWRKKASMEDWAEKILALRAEMQEKDAETLQAEFVEAVRDHPLYGTQFFHVRKHNFPDSMSVYPDRLVIAFNSEGLHFLNEERETLSSYGYADIYRWGGSSSQFSIIIWNAETQDTDDVAMLTTQAADMASLILDYINAIMASTEA